MTEKRLKIAQVNLRLSPQLKAAAEKAASSDHRSLTGLIEKLLSDYCKKRDLSSAIARRRLTTEGANKASKLATRELENLTDKSLPAEERESACSRSKRVPRHSRRSAQEKGVRRASAQPS